MNHARKETIKYTFCEKNKNHTFFLGFLEKNASKSAIMRPPTNAAAWQTPFGFQIDRILYQGSSECLV